MGVRGLTTFIANRSSQYLDRYELQNSYLVVDGNSLASQLYKWHCNCNDCFGGDYDKYSRRIYDIFQLFSACGVTPLVILDGAYEKRKLKTVYSRMRNKISAAQDLNSVSEGRVSLFPLFLRELFIDILLKLEIKCVRCEFEGDSDAAHLARTIQCPVLSYDSDFYIFDVLYIPFSTMELRLRRNKTGNYIPCEVYRVEKFLSSFGGLDKVNLPLLAVMLGNDYIKKKAFSHFYRHLKKQKTKQNEQQTLIKSVIVWLKDETPDSALRKILGRYKLRYRQRLARRIQKAIEAYQCGDTQICSYFQISATVQLGNSIVVPQPEEIEEGGEEELENSSEEELENSSEEELEEAPPAPRFAVPDFFRQNFRNGLYPPAFMDMIVSQTYFCIQQIEDFASEPAHSISFEILAAIYKILTFPRTRSLTCIGRSGRGNIKKYVVPLYTADLPTLAEIERLDASTSKATLLAILNIQDDIFNKFPDSWHLYLISIKYWVSNSKSRVGLPYIYSLVLCAIILNYVDSKVGFYRSTKSFFNKFGTQSLKASRSDPKNVTEAIDQIDLENSTECMRKLIHYFQMDAKMKCYVKLFDRSVVHEFAQFQSCLLHIRYLNSLLKFPFPSFVISDFYDGTFLYNMTTNFLKRSDLKAYVKILLQDCPKILDVFELMVGEIEGGIIDNVAHYGAPKKRRKNRRKVAKNVVPEMTCGSEDSEEEYTFDENNKYSLLYFMNK